MPRTYTQVFNENEYDCFYLFIHSLVIIVFLFVSLFLSLQRNKTNPIIDKHHQSLSMADYRRTIETVPPVVKPESLTSIYTFPSLIKPSNHWREQQSATIDSNSSAWKLFGVQRLLN